MTPEPGPVLGDSGAGLRATLILDCTACIDPSKADQGGRQADGLREWTTEFRCEPDPDHPGFDQYAPVDEAAMSCPNCGARGRVYAY